MDNNINRPLNTKENESFNNSLKLVAKSSFVVFFGILFSKLITFIYRIIIAKNLGPEPYGLFSLAFIVSSIFIAFSSFGFHDGVLRFTSFYRGREEKNKIAHLFRFSFNFILMTSAIAAIILFLLSDFIALNIFKNESLSIFLKWFSVTIPLSSLAGIFISSIMAFEKIIWQSFLRNIIQPLVQIISLIILIFLNVKNEAIIFSYLLSIFVLFLGSFLYCRYRISFLFKKDFKDKNTKKEVIKELFSYSWPLVFLSLISFIFSWFDSISIGYFLGVTEVGIYNAAVPIAALLSVTPTLFIQLLLPLITKEYARKNYKVIRELTRQVAKWIFIFNLPALIIMILFPGAIINILGFGSEFLKAENSLRFLSIGMFFYSVFIISENLLSMAGKSKTVLSNIFLSSICNIVLNIILVPRLGIEGAAISNMGTYIFWSIITMLQAKRIVLITPLKKKMITITLVSIIPTLILLFVRGLIPLNKFTLILEGIFFLLIYFFLIITTKCLDKNDWMILEAIKRKIFFKR